MEPGKVARKAWLGCSNRERWQGAWGWGRRQGQLMLNLRGHMRNLGLYPEQRGMVEALSRGEI